MTDRIRKVESDLFRVESKRETHGESEQGGSQERQRQRKKTDEFSRRPQLKPVMNMNPEAGSQHHPSLWDKPSQLQQVLHPEVTGTQAEEVSEISFLRSAGIRGTNGELQWSMIGLYSLAFFGFASAVFFIIQLFL